MLSVDRTATAPFHRVHTVQMPFAEVTSCISRMMAQCICNRGRAFLQPQRFSLIDDSCPICASPSQHRGPCRRADGRCVETLESQTIVRHSAYLRRVEPELLSRPMDHIAPALIDSAPVPDVTPALVVRHDEDYVRPRCAVETRAAYHLRVENHRCLDVRARRARARARARGLRRVPVPVKRHRGSRDTITHTRDTQDTTGTVPVKDTGGAGTHRTHTGHEGVL